MQEKYQILSKSTREIHKFLMLLSIRFYINPPYYRRACLLSFIEISHQKNRICVICVRAGNNLEEEACLPSLG